MNARFASALGTSLLLLNVAAAHGAANAVKCGATITGSVTLKGDLLCQSGHGLTVRDGGSLDCARHRIAGGGRPGQYGVYVRDSAKAAVRNCVVEAFEIGIRLRAASGVTLSGNTARDNLRYGIEVTQESAGAVIKNNHVHANGDEGIHVSGPEGRDARHQIVGNTIEGNGAEGIYLLRSHGSLIAGNTIRHHGAAGIYVKGSARNAIQSNTLVDDPLQLVYGSEQNVLIGNTVVGQQIRFKEASNNEVYESIVQESGGRPSVAFDFTRSSGNLVVDSESEQPVDLDIRATLDSVDNVFTRFSAPSALRCFADGSSSVRITDSRGDDVACGK